MQATQTTCIDCDKFNKMLIFPPNDFYNQLKKNDKAWCEIRTAYTHTMQGIRYFNTGNMRSVTREHVFHCDTCQQDWFFNDGDLKFETQNENGEWVSHFSRGGSDDYYDQSDYRLKLLYLCGLIPNRSNLTMLTQFVVTPPRPHHEKK